MLFRSVFLIILLNGVSGVMKEEGRGVTRMTDVRPAESDSEEKEVISKPLKSIVKIDKSPGDKPKPSEEEDVVVVANYGDIGRVGVTQINEGTPAIPWVPKPPIPWSNPDQPWTAPPRTSPLASWVFITIKTADLKRIMEEKDHPRSGLRSGSCNVPKIVELVKNLTSDYDNTKFVDNLNKSLYNMSMPTCDMYPLSGNASGLILIKLLSIISIGCLAVVQSYLGATTY